MQLEWLIQRRIGNKWFNRPVEEYSNWLIQLANEIVEYLIIDLLELPNTQPIIIDMGVMPKTILSLIPKERMVCLFTSPEEIEKRYLFRIDHNMILDCIKNNSIDYIETVSNVNNSIIRFSKEIVNACVSEGILTIERTHNLTINQQFKMIYEHFDINDYR